MDLSESPKRSFLESLWSQFEWISSGATGLCHLNHFSPTVKRWILSSWILVLSYCSARFWFGDLAGHSHLTKYFASQLILYNLLSTQSQLALAVAVF